MNETNHPPDQSTQTETHDAGSNGLMQNGPSKNGFSNNGASKNGAVNGSGAEAVPALASPTARSAPPVNFDQPVILRQSPLWSRAIILTLMGVTTIAVIWAFIAQVEEAVSAKGKLEPQGAVTEVQAPVGGVVKEVLVQDGQHVKQGDLLVSLDPTTAQAQQTSLQKVRSALAQEIEFYRTQTQQAARPVNPKLLASLPPEPIALTRNRAALMAENQLYRVQLGSAPSGTGLTVEEQSRLRSSRAEVSSRVNAAQLESTQLQRQLEQVRIQTASAKDLLAVDQRIFADLTKLMQEGGIARLQYLQQQQQVRTRQAEVDRGVQEEGRLQSAIAQSEERVQNTIALTQTDLLSKITDNEKRIAEIDVQLTKAMLDNEKRIAEIDAQLSQTQLTLRYQSLQAPVSGTIFDLKASAPGYVTDSTAPILKIVPDDALIAKVFITNRDIGFVREGMPVDVRIDSFPFSEFGDVKGRLVWVGSDALPPDQIYPFYRFPAKVRLEQQSLMVNGREIMLQSGMSISANVKLRKRSVASIFTDLFSKKVESLKSVR